jgi:hypothetical protein|tara:strand:+ start:45594 stop:45959 length:366 start_codon:yes stop_codon:yes gene_type:complete
MKNIWLIFLLLSLGCHSHKIEEEIDLPHPPLPDLPRHFLPPTAPPNFIPDIREVHNIQINPVPHPFNITGSHVIWVNNEKLRINKKQLNEIVKHLNLSTERPKDTAQIHLGEGWLRPFDEK